METKDLRNIWNALADNQLVDEKLAKENITEIITKKGKGLFSKMTKKTIFDYWLYLIGLIAVPLATTMVHLNLMKPLPTIQAYIGIVFVELYLVYMFINARRKLNFIESSNNSFSIKESLVAMQKRLKKAINIEYRLGVFFGIGIILLTIIQLVITGGGLSNIDFTEFSTMIVVLLLAMPFILPLLLRYEFKLRYSRITKDIEQTINELEEI